MIFLSVVIGFLFMPVYEFISLLRRLLRRGRFVCRGEDTLLAVLFAAASYYWMFAACDGNVRGYSYIFLLCGGIIGYNICSRIKIKRRLKKACGNKSYDEILKEIREYAEIQEGKGKG